MKEGTVVESATNPRAVGKVFHPKKKVVGKGRRKRLKKVSPFDFGVEWNGGSVTYHNRDDKLDDKIRVIHVPDEEEDEIEAVRGLIDESEA